ncbi:hypothetical protein [Synechococcus sp. LTW-G]
MIASFRLLRDDSGRKFGRNSAGMVDLTTLNTGLKTRGIGGRVVDHDNKLYWRTTVTSSNGKRSDRRIRLDLPSNSSQVLEAENRVIRLAAEIARLGILPDPFPWASEIRKFPDSVPNALTIAEAITQLENDFWKDSSVRARPCGDTPKTLKHESSSKPLSAKTSTARLGSFPMQHRVWPKN